MQRPRPLASTQPQAGLERSPKPSLDAREHCRGAAGGASWARRACPPHAATAAPAHTHTLASAASPSVSKCFLLWAAVAGVKAPKATQAQFGELRGYVATEDIAPGEPIVTLPASAALVLNPGQRCPPGSVAEAYWDAAPWFIKMVLLLLGERDRGQHSALWGYIEQLPACMDLPVRWEVQELEELQYPPAIEEALEQQQQWRELYADLNAALAANGSPPITWEDYLWAMEAVCSRAFAERYAGAPLRQRAIVGGAALVAAAACALLQHLPLHLVLEGVLLVLAASNVAYDALMSRLGLQLHAMCPVVDGANHSSRVQSAVAYDYFKDAFVLTARPGFSVGQQIFVRYGPHSNTALLLYYGFVEPGNAFDTYQLAVPVGGRQVLVTLDSGGRPDAQGLAELCVALEAESAQFNQQQQAHGRAPWQTLAAACQAELSQLPTSAAADEALLQRGPLPPRARLAVEFRLGKKRLLERCRLAAAAAAAAAET